MVISITKMTNNLLLSNIVKVAVVIVGIILLFYGIAELALYHAVVSGIIYIIIGAFLIWLGYYIIRVPITRTGAGSGSSSSTVSGIDDLR